MARATVVATRARCKAGRQGPQTAGDLLGMPPRHVHHDEQHEAYSDDDQDAHAGVRLIRILAQPSAMPLGPVPLVGSHGGVAAAVMAELPSLVRPHPCPMPDGVPRSSVRQAW